MCGAFLGLIFVADIRVVMSKLYGHLWMLRHTNNHLVGCPPIVKDEGPSMSDQGLDCKFRFA